MDPDGMAPMGPGDSFETEEAAALDFAKEYNGLSITYGLEIKAAIYSTTDADGVTSYSYTTPGQGGAGIAGENDLSSAPDNAVFTADIHTHGGDEAVYISAISGKEASDQNQISDPDIDVYRNRKNSEGKRNQYGKMVNGYVVTPNGGLLKYDPIKHGRDTKKTYNKPIETGGIPSDKASGTLRLNNVEPNKMPAILPTSFDPKDHEKRKGYK